MIPLVFDGIDTIFLHAWLNIKGLSLDQLTPHLKKIRWSYIITDESLVSLIKNDYATFLSSGKTMDSYFQRDVIICRGYKNSKFKIVAEKLQQKPVFIFQTANNNTFLFGAGLDNLTSTKAILCDLNLILSIYGITESPKDITQFQPKCGKTVSVYKIIDGKAFYDIESVCESPDIPIGKNKRSYFFIPDKKIIRARYFCQKFPGQCLYNTPKVGDRDKHEKICTDTSILSSKQVSGIANTSYITLILRALMVFKQMNSSMPMFWVSFLPDCVLFVKNT